MQKTYVITTICKITIQADTHEQALERFGEASDNLNQYIVGQTCVDVTDLAVLL
jgi:hypothetical protein